MKRIKLMSILVLLTLIVIITSCYVNEDCDDEHKSTASQEVLNETGDIDMQSTITAEELNKLLQADDSWKDDLYWWNHYDQPVPDIIKIFLYIIENQLTIDEITEYLEIEIDDNSSSDNFIMPRWVLNEKNNITLFGIFTEKGEIVNIILTGVREYVLNHDLEFDMERLEGLCEKINDLEHVYYNDVLYGTNGIIGNPVQWNNQLKEFVLFEWHNPTHSLYVKITEPGYVQSLFGFEH